MCPTTPNKATRTSTPGSGDAPEQRVPNYKGGSEEVQTVREREEGDGGCYRAGNSQDYPD